MGMGDTFEFFQYTSDDGSNYGIKLSANVASAGGFSTQVNPSSIKIWPYGARNLRHVLGITNTGKRTRMPCATNTQTQYVSGGTFAIGVRTYEVEGQIGEKRKVNSIG